MKWLLSCVLVLSMLVAPAVFCGCGTPGAKTAQAAGSVTITVDAAMKSWGAWVRAGRATTDQRIAVRGAYQKYQAAMLTAERLAISTMTQPDGQGAYITALNVASQSALEIIALIETFTRKP